MTYKYGARFVIPLYFVLGIPLALVQRDNPNFQNVTFRECHKGCVNNKCDVLICTTDLGCINCKKKKAAATSPVRTNPSQPSGSTNKKK